MIRKTMFITGLVILAGACNMNRPEMMEKQLQQKKAKLRQLNEEIAALESAMKEDSSGSAGYVVPVSVKTVQPEQFDHFIEVSGKLEAEEDALISPEMNGQIDRIHVKEGDRVREGQLLVSLNTSLIESNIKEVKTGLELATKLFEKQADLWEQQIGSELQYLEAKNAKEQAEARLATLQAQLDMARIKAPFSGVVESILRKEGELAAPGVQLIQLVSLDNLKLYGNISERYLMSVKKGDEVLVRFPDIEGLQVRAPIHRVGDVIDDKNRTFRIEVKIPNTDQKLKPNLFCTIRVNDFSKEDAFVVPSFALKQDIKGHYLYVANRSDNTARKRYVETALTYNEDTMVAEGLNEGDEVIVRGFAQVSDGVSINIMQTES